MKTMNFFLLALLMLIGSMAVIAQDEGEGEGEAPETEEEVPEDDLTTDTVDPDTAIGSITKFYLWDASVPKQVVEITNGKKWCPGNLAKFSIEAKVSGHVRSVYMKLSGPVSVGRTENAAPWFLYGNDGYSKVYPVTVGNMIKPLKNGVYEITAQAFERHHKGGRGGTRKTIRFTIDCSVICRRC